MQKVPYNYITLAVEHSTDSVAVKQHTLYSGCRLHRPHTCLFWQTVFLFNNTHYFLVVDFTDHGDCGSASVSQMITAYWLQNTQQAVQLLIAPHDVCFSRQCCCLIAHIISGCRLHRPHRRLFQQAMMLFNSTHYFLVVDYTDHIDFCFIYIDCLQLRIEWNLLFDIGKRVESYTQQILVLTIAKKVCCINRFRLLIKGNHICQLVIVPN